MTSKELNKAVKALWSEHYRMTFEQNEIYFSWVEKTAKPEFSRLYYADDSLESLTKESLLMMLSLNRLLRVIPFHHFGNQSKF
jgi:hypothetical protein